MKATLKLKKSDLLEKLDSRIEEISTEYDENLY